MKESDWILFKKIKEMAIDSFCSDVLSKSNEIISDGSTNTHDRYLHLYKHIQNKNKEMSLLFDGHSRSKANMQLFSIRIQNLAEVKSLRTSCYAMMLLTGEFNF